MLELTRPCSSPSSRLAFKLAERHASSSYPRSDGTRPPPTGMLAAPRMQGQLRYRRETSSYLSE